MKNNNLWWLAGGAALLFLTTSKGDAEQVANDIDFNTPRGYRNNNPGNIIITSTPWLGEIFPNDGVYKRFVTMPMGYRAMFMNLDAYLKSGYNTIRKIITRWGDPKQDKTGYINFVATRAGVNPDEVVSFGRPTVMKNIAAAIARFENGQEPNLNDVETGYQLYGRI